MRQTATGLTDLQFASVAAIQASAPRSDIAINHETARAVCIVWTKASLDCLEHSRRSGEETLADLQAMITVFFLVYNLEGFSARLRSGLTTGIALARGLGLHRIDHPADRRHIPPHKQNNLELEVMRRVWWHVTATDW